ncbi:MAG: alanyl-tRNA editing protein, partial [Chloroflexia bacterium]
MPAERLYYDDPFLWRFSARVTGRRTLAGRPAVALDRTAFYPTSGGQPHDLGTIAGIPVLEVVEEDDEIWHILSDELPQEEVTGQVDGERRFDHMQQHTGQHILSQAFLERCGARTVAFHLGATESTVDLDRVDLSPETLHAVEERVNEIIFQDRPVIARFVSPEELSQLPLRKPPRGRERVRVVEVEGYDWTPCGGTHCTRSGQVGLLRILRADRQKDETRITFLCGWRAVRDARWKHEALTRVATSLSVGIPDLPETVSRLAASVEELRRALAYAQRRLLQAEASELYREGEILGEARLVVAHWKDRPWEEVRTLARAIAALPGGVALLGVTGESARLCFARAEGLPWDMAALVRE